jgi:hypothetical protein
MGGEGVIIVIQKLQQFLLLIRDLSSNLGTNT